jgi:hypothetical protein
MRKNIAVAVLFVIIAITISACRSLIMSGGGVYSQRDFNARVYKKGETAYIAISQSLALGDRSEVSAISKLEFTNEKGEIIAIRSFSFGNGSYLIPPGQYKLTRVVLIGQRMLSDVAMPILGRINLDLTGLFDAGFTVNAGEAVYLGFIEITNVAVQKIDEDKKSRQYYVYADIEVVSSTQIAYYFSQHLGKEVSFSPIEFIRIADKVEKTIKSKFTVKIGEKNFNKLQVEKEKSENSEGVSDNKVAQ